MVLTPEEKELRRKKAEKAFGEFLSALGYDWQDDPSLKETPRRVAKVYLDELGSGAYNKPPKITTFPNENEYTGIVFQGDIDVNSFCAHHWLVISGFAYVAYIPTPKTNIIGLSKLNRVVEFFASRPQTQENLTRQIHDYLEEILGETLGIIVHIKADHSCVKTRGVKHNSEMQTCYCSGRFLSNELHSREEFYNMMNNCKK